MARFRIPLPTALSIAIHIAVIGAFVKALATQRELEWIRHVQPLGSAPSVRIRYAQLPRLDQPVNASVVDRPNVPSGSVPPPLLPTRVEPAVAQTAKTTPSTLLSSPTAPATSAPDSARSTALGIPAEREGVVLNPIRRDARIWGTSAPRSTPEPSRAKELEESLARGVRASNDSIAALGVQTIHPEWVITRNGRKYGIDNTTIHLGPVSVGAVVLGLLPIRNYGCMPTLYLPERPVRDSAGVVCVTLENPSVAGRAERIQEMSSEIRARSEITQRGREEVARIAARKDRERAARLKALRGEPVPRLPPP